MWYLLIIFVAGALISHFYMSRRAESGYYGAKVFNTFKLIEVFNLVANEIGEGRPQALVQGRHIFESKMIEFLEKNRSSQQMKEAIRVYETELQDDMLEETLPGIKEKAAEIARETVEYFFKIEFEEMDKSEISSRRRRR